METNAKLKPYSDEEVEAKIKEHGLDGWYLDGELAAAQVQHRRLADDAHARQHDRLLCPRRPTTTPTWR